MSSQQATQKWQNPEYRQKQIDAHKGHSSNDALILWRSNGGKVWNKGVSVRLSPKGEFKKGLIPWNKNKSIKIKKICLQCSNEFIGYNKRKFCSKLCFDLNFKGEKNPNWIADRTKLKKRQQRNDSAYHVWRMEIWKRDEFKCKLDNQDCDGSIEAHHILPWVDYPELRYEINNGITLCHHHHPRKRIDEKQLAPIFQELLKG